jgi:hypothetical protein
MLQRAMQLKQKKILEHIKGNPFDCLQSDTLYQIANDVNVKFGRDSSEAKTIIDNLIADGQNCYEQFITQNPEVLLPTDLDVSDVHVSRHVHGTEIGKDEIRISGTPIEVVKVIDNSPPWTEVVRRGKSRVRCTSKTNVSNERRTLEY